MRRCLAGIALTAFLLRALIPAGFMPSTDRPFSLEFCPASFPAEWLAHAGHSGDHVPAHHHSNDGSDSGKTGYEHCPFGSGSSAAPLPAAALALLVPVEPVAVDFISLPSPYGERLIRAQQARAPPHFS